MEIFIRLTISNFLYIVILLILSGISIAALTNTGLFEKAKDAKIETKISEIEEAANLIHLSLATEKYTGNLEEILMSDIASQLISKGYQIEQVATSGNVITGISLDKNSITITKNGTATIKVTYEGSSDGNLYYAVIDGKYYKMILTDSGVKVERTASEIEGTPSTDTLAASVTSGSSVTAVEINGNVITITGGDETGTSTITVTYGSYSKTCEISVVLKPTEGSTPDSTITISTEYGRIDVIWLDGTTNTVAAAPNAPVLTSNVESMTPVSWTYDSTAGTWNEDETTQSTWYNYRAGTGTDDNLTSMWANAKTANGSYFVWIPRYAYRITYYEGETSTTPTGYYDGYGMWNATDGTVKYALESGVETVDYNGEKYIVHPAFETNLDLGGWSSDLSGFWFAKYEMSGSGSTTGSSSTLKSVPNVASLKSTTIGNQYKYARNANYGYTGTSETLTSNGTDYTYTCYMNSHLVKNSEWGAVVYLTQSQYGRNGYEIDINNSSSFITGNGGGAVSGSVSSASGTKNAYNTITGAKASTTGNVYGIYDMSGGANEYAASFDKLGSNTYVVGSSYGLNMTQEAKDSSGNYVSTKYITAYSNGTSTDYGTSIYTIGKTGDSTKEAYIGSGSTGWFSDSSYFVHSSNAFFIRGGTCIGGFSAGVFRSYYYNGASYSYNSFRAALAQ